MTNLIFEKYLNDNAASVDEYIQGAFGPGSHPDMDRYLYAPLSDYARNGGKRHRPLICMIACRAVGGKEK